MATLTITQVDLATFLPQVQSLYDLAHKERLKGERKNDSARIRRAAEMDRVLDMLNGATVSE